MKKGLLILLICFLISNYSWAAADRNSNKKNSLVNTYYTVLSESPKGYSLENEVKFSNNHINKNNSAQSKLNYNTKRDYDYLYYKNSNNYTIKNKDDIKNSIYNGLNSGKTTITLYCAYDDNDECLNDFYSIYNNKLLMASINNYVNPYNKYSSTAYKININNGNVKIEISIDKKYTEEQTKEIDKIIDSYLSQFNLNTMNDEEKIKLAHDFLVDKNRYYNSSNDAYSAYGAIVGNDAICQGYAEAMALFLDRFNIPNTMISNNIHIWNLVNVDGKWLHLDLTWDDPILTSGRQIKIYDYYLITSERLSKLDNSENHKYNSNYYLETSIN